MKKIRVFVFIIVFWWSLFCPPLGFPEDSMKMEPSAQETVPNTPSQVPEVHFELKYLKFLNFLFE